MQPGIHHNVIEREYHALPYLGSSGMKLLIDECPAIFRHQADHPEADKPDRDKEIGTVAHLLALEPARAEARTVVIGAADYKTKAAQELRAEAYKAGKCPILMADIATVHRMNDALLTQVGDLFTGGRAEVTGIHKDETGVMLKARWDYVKPGRLIDFKTTGNAAPEAFKRRVVDNGHHLQAAHYVDTWEALTGERAEWLWVVQSTEPPYLVAVYKPMPSVLDVGRQLYRAAIDLFARCTEAGEWPGYGDSIIPIELPGYAMHQFQERDERGDFRPREIKRRPAEAQIDRAIGAFAP
jgi:hypothetical protein